jgi:hypothetical protein
MQHPLSTYVYLAAVCKKALPIRRLPINAAPLPPLYVRYAASFAHVCIHTWPPCARRQCPSIDYSSMEPPSLPSTPAMLHLCTCMHTYLAAVQALPILYPAEQLRILAPCSEPLAAIVALAAGHGERLRDSFMAVVDRLPRACICTSCLLVIPRRRDPRL